MGELPEGSILLGCSSSGIYLPKEIADSCHFDMETVIQEDLDICKEGPTPDNEWYWEAWDHILDYGMIYSKDPNDKGKRWTLYQDGDVWAIPEDAKWPEEEC